MPGGGLQGTDGTPLFPATAREGNQAGWRPRGFLRLPRAGRLWILNIRPGMPTVPLFGAAGTLVLRKKRTALQCAFYSSLFQDRIEAEKGRGGTGAAPASPMRRLKGAGRSVAGWNEKPALLLREAAGVPRPGKKLQERPTSRS